MEVHTKEPGHPLKSLPVDEPYSTVGYRKLFQSCIRRKRILKYVSDIEVCPALAVYYQFLCPWYPLWYLNQRSTLANHLGQTLCRRWYALALFWTDGDGQTDKDGRDDGDETN